MKLLLEIKTESSDNVLCNRFDNQVGKSVWRLFWFSCNTYIPGGYYNWQGSPLTLSRNGNTIGVLESGFTVQDFCLAIDQVDQENDIFEISTSGGDKVSDRPSFFVVLNFHKLTNGLRVAWLQ